MVLQDRKRNILRINEIARVLIKYGFDSFAQKISDKNIGFLPVNKIIADEIPSDANVRLRYVLEELGTTFIKLGQTLSTYPELIGFELADELSKLQESAPIDDFESVKQTIENEFSKPLEDIFEEFSKEPIASASIGQVHTAYLNNKFVAVKVQHPGIEEKVYSDIKIMHTIAKRLDNRVEQSKSYNLPGLVDVFEKDMVKELNYEFEAMNAIHIGDILKDDDVYIPEVYLDYTTSKVLTMEYLDGVSLNTVIKSDDGVYDKREIALQGADSFFKQILIHGFYHADPHPGNIFVLKDNMVAFVDFGMVGHLDNDLREDLAKLFIFISEGDAKLLTKQLVYMGIVDDDSVNYKEIEYEVMLLLDRYYGIQFNDVSGVLRGLVRDDVLNKYGVVLPRDLMMVIRTISMIDDVGRELDPTFNTTAIVKPYALKMLMDMVQPKRLLTKTTEKVMDFQHLWKKLPKSLLIFFEVVDEGHLNIAIDDDEIDRISVIISRIVNELVIAIITAAMLIGSSLIMLAENGVKFLDYPILGFIGFTFSLVLGVILIIIIIKRGNYL